MKILGEPKEKIAEAVKSGKITIAVYGLGKVGLPLALAYASSGLRVIGVDINPKIVEMVNNSVNFLPHEPLVGELLKKHIKEGNLRATTDTVKAAENADVVSIIVPTLADENGIPLLKPLFSACKSVGKGLKKRTLVIIESTVPPGTTEGPVREILESESGLKAGEDFGLVFSPERVKSGTVIADFLENYPKIVGGINRVSTETAAYFYEAIVKRGVVKVRNARTAEAVKVYKGIYRYVNIALANELAKISEKIGVDILEAINAANTEPYSHIHKPGPGVGGHCIPIYPYFLTYIARKIGFDLSLVRNARIIDNSMPYHTVQLVIEGLNEAEKPVKNSKITVFGLTFRGDVKATVLTPALPIIKRLKEMKAQIKAHDPYLSKEEIANEFGVEKVDSIKEGFKDADAVVFVADHKVYKDLELDEMVKLMKKPPVIIDSRNIFDLNKIREFSNLIYRGIGRGSHVLDAKIPDYISIIKRDLLAENMD